MADNSGRSLLEMLQGGGAAGSQQQQQQPMLPYSAPGHMPPPRGQPMTPPPHMVDGQMSPFFHGGPPPPPMSQGMPPGFGFSRPDMDPHPMLMQIMQPGQQRPLNEPPPGMGMRFPGPQPPHSRPNSQNSNALASLLQSLNQPTGGPAPGSSLVSTPPPVGHNLSLMAEQGPPPAPSATQMDLQASTESLKMALFGGIPPPEPAPAAQSPHAVTTEGLKMALFGSVKPDSAPPAAVPVPTSAINDEGNQLLAMLQKSSSAGTPPSAAAEQQRQDIKHEPVVRQEGASGESIIPSPALPPLPSSRESTPQSSSKSKFTYVNPFLSFTSNSPQTTNVSSVSNASAVSPSSSRTATPTSALAISQQEVAPPAPTVTQGQSILPAPIPIQAAVSAPAAPHHPKRSSVVSPLPRRETPTHAESNAHQARSQDRDQKRYQVDQLLPPHSAWNHRVQKLSRGSSGVPDGVYLSHPADPATIVYDTGLDNTDAIFSEDLETIPITLIPTEVEYNHGKMVAVSKGYISYAAKGGKIRVIQQSHGHRTLLRGHTDQVIDMGFSAESTGDPATLQLLASVGKDSRLIIWNLSGSDVDSSDIAHSKHMELLGVPIGDKARYSRVAWSPSEQYMLALVNNDEHSVILVDIQKLMEKIDNVIVEEAQVLENAVVIKAHDQPINDIAFSPDGTILMTASEDGSVKLWEVGMMEATFLKEFVPHGGLGVTNALFIDCADGNAARCVITTCRRGTELTLWHVTGSGPLDQFNFKEPPVSARRSSLGKSAARVQDLRMFNFLGYDFETQSLLLANSARLSLFGLKIAIDGEGDLVSRQLSQSDYLKKSLAVDPSSSPVSAKFEFMIEYPMPQPVISFVVMPDSSLENNGFSVYCIQSKAVQQYVIKGLEPHDKHNCLTFVSSAPSATKAIDAVSKPKAVKGNLTRSSSASSTSKVNVLGLGMKDDSAIDADLSAASTARPTSATAADGEKEPEKPFKLHGPVINGAIAKLKERKRNALAASSGGDGLVTSSAVIDKKEATSSGNKAVNAGRTSRKGSQDIGTPAQAKSRSSAGATQETKVEQGGKSSNSNRQNRQNQQRGGGGDSSVGGSPSLDSTLTGIVGAAPGGSVTISTADLQALLQAIDDKVAARVERSVKKEMEQQYLRMEESQVARQEELVKLVSQTLTKNTEQLLEQTVRKEIQSSVVPSLTKIISNTVERQLSRTITDAVVMSLPNTIDTAMSENVSRVMGSSAFMTKLTNQVATTIRPSIEESFRESFNKVLIPAYQKATQAMFEQITATFEDGVADLTAASAKDQTTLEAVVRELKSTNEDVHTGLLRIQAQLSRSSASLGQPQRTFSGHHDDIAPISGHDSQRVSQLTSPTTARVLTEDDVIINQCVSRGDFEGAFTRALSTNDSTIVLRLCSNLSPRTVFPHNVVAGSAGALSQPILLALIHHLATADMLNGDLNVRLPWLQECLLRLNSKDPLISEHIVQILRAIQPHLQEAYLELMRRGDPSSHVQTLQMLLRAIQRMGV